MVGECYDVPWLFWKVGFQQLRQQNTQFLCLDSSLRKCWTEAQPVAAAVQAGGLDRTIHPQESLGSAVNLVLCHVFLPLLHSVCVCVLPVCCGKCAVTSSLKFPASTAEYW